MINQTDQMLYRLSNLDALQQKNSYQMSTHKKLQQGSDDSVLYSRLTFVDDKIRTYEGLKTQMERTTVQNNTADSSMSEIKEIFRYVQQELIKANTATTTEDGLKSIAVNLAGMKQNLYDLANTQVEGEYVFAGSDSSVKPFEKDTDGNVTYVGNNKLRRVAVEEGSYRERGITGLDMMMFSSSIAYKGETLNFKEDDRIIDQDGNEWKMREPISNEEETLSFSVKSPNTSVDIIDGNNVIWTLDTLTGAPYFLKDLDGGGSINVNYDPASSSYSLVVPTGSKNMGVNELVKYNLDNEIVIPEEILKPTVGELGREIITPSVDGTKFEAKSNIFNLMDEVVNSLSKRDSSGNKISLSDARMGISDGLGKMDKAFDAVNIAHAELGARNKVFEVSLERVSSKLTQYDVLSQEIASADLTKVAMEAKSLELTYTALYSTISKTNELSLVNFLK